MRVRDVWCFSLCLGLLTSPALADPPAAPKLPAGREVRLGPVSAGSSQPEAQRFQTFLLESAAVFSNRDVADARVMVDTTLGNPEVALTLTAEAAGRFEKYTEQHVGERLAIVIEDLVQVAPVIYSKITGGRLRITLGGMPSLEQTIREARELSLLFRFSHPPLKFLRQSVAPDGLELVFQAPSAGQRDSCLKAVEGILGEIRSWAKGSGGKEIIKELLGLGSWFTVAPGAADEIRIVVSGDFDVASAVRLLARSGRIEFKTVDDRTPFFAGLKDRLSGGITLEPSVFHTPDGGTVETSHLVIPGTRDEAERKLAAILGAAAAGP